MRGIRDDRSGASAAFEQGGPAPRSAGYVAPEEHDKLLDLADTLAVIPKEQFEDPLASLAILSAEAGRMMGGREADLAGEAARARNDPCITISESSAGGAMPTPTNSSTRRPYHGFDVERATYERIQIELLKTSEGMFVVIVGDACVGPLESDEAAERSGYEAFGLGPLYIRQVRAAEPPALVTRDVAICRT